MKRREFLKQASLLPVAAAAIVSQPISEASIKPEAVSTDGERVTVEYVFEATRKWLNSEVDKFYALKKDIFDTKWINDAYNLPESFVCQEERKIFTDYEKKIYRFKLIGTVKRDLYDARSGDSLLKCFVASGEDWLGQTDWKTLAFCQYPVDYYNLRYRNAFYQKASPNPEVNLIEVRYV
jgi:hypothetical protein